MMMVTKVMIIIDFGQRFSSLSRTLFTVEEMEPEMLTHWNLVFPCSSGELQSREAVPSRGNWNVFPVAGVNMGAVLIFRQPELSGHFQGCKKP